MKFSCGCNERIEDDYGDVKSDKLFLPPNKKFELIIDYPLQCPTHIKFNTGKTGMGYMALVKKIKKEYARIYAEDDSGSERYGVYGHGIEDLVLERISIDFGEKLITLDIGS
jgi:hypothetical protein